MLEVQKLCLKDLAVEENHVKDFARIPDLSSTINLEKSHEEVERVINALHHRERRSDHSDAHGGAHDLQAWSTSEACLEPTAIWSER